MKCVILKTPLEKDAIFNRLKAYSAKERHTVWNFLEDYEDGRVGAHMYTKASSKYLKGYWENGSRGHTGHLHPFKMWFYIFFKKSYDLTVVYAVIFPSPLLMALLFISIWITMFDALVLNKLSAIIGIMIIVLCLAGLYKSVIEDNRDIKKWLRKQVEP